MGAMSAACCAKCPHPQEIVGVTPIGTAPSKPYRRRMAPLSGAQLGVQLGVQLGARHAGIAK